jgi:transcriptional regulator with XRE-family HTH domain
MNFGSRIRQLRVDRGLSLRDFANAVGIDFTYLSKIENGKVEPPSEEKIRLMAHQLDKDAEELLGLAGKFSPDQMRKAVEDEPNVGRLLRRIQSRELSSDQIKQMLNIATDKDKGEAPNDAD